MNPKVEPERRGPDAGSAVHDESERERRPGERTDPTGIPGFRRGLKAPHGSRWGDARPRGGMPPHSPFREGTARFGRSCRGVQTTSMPIVACGASLVCRFVRRDSGDYAPRGRVRGRLNLGAPPRGQPEGKRLAAIHIGHLHGNAPDHCKRAVRGVRRTAAGLGAIYRTVSRRIIPQYARQRMIHQPKHGSVPSRSAISV